MSFLGSALPILASLTASDWVKIAAAAPEIVGLLMKLEVPIEDALAAVKGRVTALAETQHPDAPAAHKALHSLKAAAWTAADQRAADFQSEGRQG